MQKKILILAEHDNQHLKMSTHHVVTAAKVLAEQSNAKDITVLVAGSDCVSVANECRRFLGLTQILLLDNPAFKDGLAENVASAIAALGKEFDFILGPATTFGKNILPRIAALLNVGMVSEITRVLSEDTYIRPIYAGNALATVKSLDAIKVISIRTTAFEAAALSEEKSALEAPIETPNLKTNADLQLSEFMNRQESESLRPELTNARVVIAGGRGLQSKENFKLLDDLADKLNAAIGASRAAVDAGFVPNDYQIGQTGKVVAPELYIAVGISGAIQHLAGMKDSKVIVAINKDADAPIFKVADYGMVGDLFAILPELSQELASKRDKT